MNLHSLRSLMIFSKSVTIMQNWQARDGFTATALDSLSLKRTKSLRLM